MALHDIKFTLTSEIDDPEETKEIVLLLKKSNY